MENGPVTAKLLDQFFHIDSNVFDRQYKYILSGYKEWAEADHAEDWLTFKDNIGESICIDETALSNGDLYTIVTNRAAHCRKGTIIAIVKGTQVANVVAAIKTIPLEYRNRVREITRDFSFSMARIAEECFPKAYHVIDRFHVQQLLSEATQELRIAHRWKAIADENEAITKARAKGEQYKAVYLENGDTPKQLLIRSRYLLFKAPDKWSPSQARRADVLFSHYPDIKSAYDLSQGIRSIYAKAVFVHSAQRQLAQWFEDVKKANLSSFNTIQRTFLLNQSEILNFFINRATNASAESFNAKVKSFRAMLRGVTDTKFFLFRLCKLYA